MNRNALPIAGAVIAAGVAGYLFGAAHTSAADTPAPAVPVHVSVVLEESGEVRSVELTDDNGHDVEVGSIAEEWPHLERDYADELDDSDQSTETDG